MKRMVIVFVVTFIISGCATTPNTAVTQLNQNNEKYSTQECMQARKVALNYDDNVLGRIGIGLGLGLLLGPIGLPFGLVADLSQADKRGAVLTELNKHCK